MTPIRADLLAAKLKAARNGEAQRFAETGLRAAGIRVVPIDPAMLPRHHQLRALVYGDAQQVS